MTSSNSKKDFERKKLEIVFHALMNIDYHEGIERGCSTFINATTFISIIFSSASFILVTKLIPDEFYYEKNIVIAILTFVITILNGISLAFGLSHKLETHRSLKKKWIQIYGKAKLLKDNVKKIDAIELEMHQLNSIEPPPNKKKLLTSYNKACAALGLDSGKNIS